MKEIIITSSALILVLLALRRVFQKTLSRRWQYALWALVLVRLLLPVSFLPAANFSVLTATAPVQQAVEHQFNDRLYYSHPVGQISPEELSERNISLSSVPTAEEGAAMILMEPPAPGSDISYQQRGYLVRDAETNSVTLYQRMTVGWGDTLAVVWKAGMALMGCFFLLSNLIFYRRLRKNRQAFAADALSGGRRVYLVPEGSIPSPCLFGLFNAAIYITPAVANDPVKLRHVLAHESTHAKHLDPLWSLLRCVCLTVYWFDPLVWIAAGCSKTDCELACDESVLKALGESERIGYGETLVSLIPVRKGPANPMLAATTMTAGKKQLKDRITRIAQKPRQVMAAVVAVAILASIAAACTFTGGKATPTPAPSESTAPEAEGLRALTGEELRWFNEEFFNSSGADQTGTMDYAYNIRNQFANPIILYDRPQDIDLAELFYCDGEAVPDDELSIVWAGYDPDIPLPCMAYKLTADAINSILKYYTGLTLSEANKDSLTYTYSQEHNAYYWMHGDTNYCGDLQFSVGTQEGDTVKLYHSSDFAGSNWYCVTLTDKGGGQYWFVSNQVSAKPTIATPLPAWEVDKTIPLDGAERQLPQNVPTITYPASDFPGGYENRLDNWDFDGNHVMAYKTADGQARVALVWDGGGFNVFLSMDAEQYGGMFFFHDLFGHDGFYVDHTAEGIPQRNYYYFDDKSMPILLLEAATSVRGGAFQLDLDGDGSDELIADETVFFQREDNVYRADLKELVTAACPELTNWDWSQWNVYGKCLYVRGYTEDYREWARYLYFDGKNILVYKDEKPTTGHLVDGAARNVPAPVTEQAMEYARSVYETQEGQDGMGTLDDWRIEAFYGPYRTQVGELTVEAWAFNYECHTATPDTVSMAGGRYMTEDNWVSPGYPGCDYLFFLRDSWDGSLTYLWHGMNNDMAPGSSAYNQYVEDKLVELGYRQEIGSFSSAAQDAAARLERIIDLGGGEVILQLTTLEGGGGVYTVPADEGNGPYYRRNFTETSQYRWRYADSVPDYPMAASLTITAPSWEYYIRMWEGSNLVMIKPDDEGATWYEVEPNVLKLGEPFYERTQIFNFMRQWFDEAELEDKRSVGAALEYVEGESYLELAHRWAACYEMPRMNLTAGSSAGACSYVKVTDEEVIEDMPETWFPQDILQYPHFAFSYTTIFVPSNEYSLSYMMAGNTGEYEGDDPEVPEGAFEYYRRGSLYLKDGYWYCGSIGTG